MPENPAPQTDGVPPLSDVLQSVMALTKDAFPEADYVTIVVKMPKGPSVTIPVWCRATRPTQRV